MQAVYLNGGEEGAEGDAASDTGTYTVEPASHYSRHAQARPGEHSWSGQFRRPQRRGFVDSDDELEAAENLGKKPRLRKPSSVPGESSGKGIMLIGVLWLVFVIDQCMLCEQSPCVSISTLNKSRLEVLMNEH